MTDTVPSPEELQRLIRNAFDDMKAEKPVVIDVRGRTAITDLMAVASGTSRRHVKSIADRVAERAREAGVKVLGTEGEDAGDWILVDLGDAVVHVMREEVRDFYRIEDIWSMDEDMAREDGTDD